MTESTSQRNEYLLGHSSDEQERLRRLPGELALDCNRFLDQFGIQRGSRAVDLGCGPHGILDLLSERVGDNGTVVGVEQSESTIKLAQQFIAEYQLRNVELLRGDAKATGLPRASFDVVHARLVLVNLPEPQQVVEEMVALARPGGVVASQEADWGASICDPPLIAWERWWQFLGLMPRAWGGICQMEPPRPPEAENLVQFGLHEGPPNQHPGQGTACRRFAFLNAMIELVWVSDKREAQSHNTRRTLLWERWSGRKDIAASPFGICLRPVDPEDTGPPPFPAWEAPTAVQTNTWSNSIRMRGSLVEGAGQCAPTHGVILSQAKWNTPKQPVLCRDEMPPQRFICPTDEAVCGTCCAKTSSFFAALAA
jgi:SAM-dependent methyltransferase